MLQELEQSGAYFENSSPSSILKKRSDDLKAVQIPKSNRNIVSKQFDIKFHDIYSQLYKSKSEFNFNIQLEKERAKSSLQKFNEQKKKTDRLKKMKEDRQKEKQVDFRLIRLLQKKKEEEDRQLRYEYEQMKLKQIEEREKFLKENQPKEINQKYVTVQISEFNKNKKQRQLRRELSMQRKSLKSMKAEVFLQDSREKVEERYKEKVRLQIQNDQQSKIEKMGILKYSPSSKRQNYWKKTVEKQGVFNFFDSIKNDPYLNALSSQDQIQDDDFYRTTTSTKFNNSNPSTPYQLSQQQTKNQFYKSNFSSQSQRLPYKTYNNSVNNNNTNKMLIQRQQSSTSSSNFYQSYGQNFSQTQNNFGQTSSQYGLESTSVFSSIKDNGMISDQDFKKTYFRCQQEYMRDFRRKKEFEQRFLMEQQYEEENRKILNSQGQSLPGSSKRAQRNLPGLKNQGVVKKKQISLKKSNDSREGTPASARN